jgi:hypothetical protein
MNLDQYSKLRTSHIKTQNNPTCKYQAVYFVDDIYPYNITKEHSMYVPANDRIVCGIISDIENGHGIYLDSQLHNYFIFEKDAHNKQRNRLFDYRAQKELTTIR